MLNQFLLTAAFSALALGAALAAEPASLSGDELLELEAAQQSLAKNDMEACKSHIHTAMEATEQ